MGALPTVWRQNVLSGSLLVLLLLATKWRCFSQTCNMASIPQGEPETGTGTWRGMLKRGDEAPAEDKARLQAPLPASPQKGHAINLLDVVGASSILERSQSAWTYLLEGSLKRTVMRYKRFI